MKNTCGHTYSKEGIMSMLRGKPTVKCPMPGCKQLVSTASLSDDVEMRVEIEQMMQAKERQGDDDEVTYTQID